jgi:hypothetical protein
MRQDRPTALNKKSRRALECTRKEQEGNWNIFMNLRYRLVVCRGFKLASFSNTLILLLHDEH